MMHFLYHYIISLNPLDIKHVEINPIVIKQVAIVIIATITKDGQE